MRVVIAPHAFPGLLTAMQVGEALSSGWSEAAPADDVRVHALSDGGPGFLEVIAGTLPGDMHACIVDDPLRRPTPAQLFLSEDGTTAYVEAAQACGLHLLAAGERSPGTTTSYGLGQLLDAALASGARRIVVGVGGTAVNDGGAGMLAALGAGPRGALDAGGLGLIGVQPHDILGLPGVISRFAGVTLEVASAVTAPLLGFQGTSAMYAGAKGARPEEAQSLEAAMSLWAARVREVVPARHDREPGAGAGGGIGYALYCLGGRHVGGVPAVIAATRFKEAVRQADLLLVAQGELTWVGLANTPVAHAARTALETGIPVVALAGAAEVTRRDVMDLGIAGVYPVARTPAQHDAMYSDPVTAVRDMAARLARSWSTSIR